jgi:hypothetical protein
MPVPPTEDRHELGQIGIELAASRAIGVPGLRKSPFGMPG